MILLFSAGIQIEIILKNCCQQAIKEKRNTTNEVHKYILFIPSKLKTILLKISAIFPVLLAY
jgi:hypothetical protein